MRIVFIGTAPLACRGLEALARSGADEVVGVVTQPDRPKGRHLHITPSAVKTCAERLQTPVITPERINALESLAALRQWRPDLAVVIAYGQMLHAALLRLPPRGCINVHASLLPKYRGAAPVPWALARGERVTGVTTMFVNERLDAGDIILQREVPIAAADTAATLQDRLAEAGAELLVATVAALRDGTAPRRPQNEADATLAPKLHKQDGWIDWTRPAAEICNRVRGFNPWPGCWIEWPAASGHHLRILRAAVVPGGAAAPGTPCTARGAWIVQAGEDAVQLIEVQPEGRRAMSADAFLRGHHAPSGGGRG